MPNMTLKNTNRAIYIKTSGDASSAVYSRLGEGVTSFTPSNNPTVDTQHYINASSPTHNITAIEKQYSFAADFVMGDAAIDYIASLDGATGEKCKSELIDVLMTTETEPSEGYPAKKYQILISLEQPYSIEGGQTEQMTGTFYTNGDYVEGTFKTSTGKFTPAS